MLPLISQHCTLTPPLCIATTKQGRLCGSGAGEGNRAAGAVGMDLGKSRLHLLPFHAKVVEALSPDLVVVPLCLEKCTGFMESVPKSHLALHTSRS